MRKYIICLIVLMAASSVSSNVAVKAQDNHTSKVVTVSADSTHAICNVDSIRVKGIRLGHKIAEGALVAADSIKAYGMRVGEKAQPLADTIVERSRQAWRVLKGEEPMPTKQKK